MATSRSNTSSSARPSTQTSSSRSGGGGKASSSETSSTSATSRAGTAALDSLGLGDEALGGAPDMLTQLQERASVLQDWSHQPLSNARLQAFADGRDGTSAQQAAASAVLSAKSAGYTTGQAIALARDDAREVLSNAQTAQSISSKFAASTFEVGIGSKVSDAGGGGIVANASDAVHDGRFEAARVQQALNAAASENHSIEQSLYQAQQAGGGAGLGGALAEARATDEALSTMRSESWSMARIQEAASGEGYSAAQQAAATAVLGHMESISRSGGVSETVSVDRGNHTVSESWSMARIQEAANREGSSAAQQSAAAAVLGHMESTSRSSGSTESVSYSQGHQSVVAGALAEANAETQALSAMQSEGWSMARLQEAAEGEGYSAAQQAAAQRVLDAYDRGLGMNAYSDQLQTLSSMQERLTSQESVSREVDGVAEVHVRTISLETDKGRAELLADVARTEDSVSAANALVQLRDNAVQLEDRVPDLAAAIYNSVPPVEALASSAELAREGGQVDVQAYLDAKFSPEQRESAASSFQEAAEQLRAEQGPRADVASEKLEAFAESLKTGDGPAILAAQTEMVGAVSDLVREVARESTDRLAEELPAAPEGALQRVTVQEYSTVTTPSETGVPDVQQESATTVYKPEAPADVVQSETARFEASNSAAEMADVMRSAGQPEVAESFDQLAQQYRTGSESQIAAAQDEVMATFEAEFGQDSPSTPARSGIDEATSAEAGRDREFAETEKAALDREAEMAMGE